MIVQFNILKHSLNLFMFVTRWHTFEIAEYLKVLTGGEIFKKDIVLGADSQKLSHFVHFIEQVHSENFGATFGRFDQSCQHANKSSFSCTIMAEEGENLSSKHSEVDSFNPLESIVVSFLEVLDFEDSIFRFLH